MYVMPMTSLNDHLPSVSVLPCDSLFIVRIPCDFSLVFIEARSTKRLLLNANHTSSRYKCHRLLVYQSRYEDESYGDDRCIEMLRKQRLYIELYHFCLYTTGGCRRFDGPLLDSRLAWRSCSHCETIFSLPKTCIYLVVLLQQT